MNKKEAAKKYGKERCAEVHNFLDRLNRYYDFPYSEKNLFDFLEDLDMFTIVDLKACLDLLKERESTYRIKFNEIFNTCKAAKKIRTGREEEEKPEEKTDGIKMPASFKEKYINPILKRS